MEGQAERSVHTYRLFRKKPGDVCRPRGKSQWGDHTVEEKGGEEEMKQGPREREGGRGKTEGNACFKMSVIKNNDPLVI